MPDNDSDTISEADIWLSRVNIAHARSQKLLQSWLPASTSASAPSHNADTEDDDESNFLGMTESAGLGTTAHPSSDLEVDGILKKRHASSHDKLLEQLLGKKAAAAKKKEQALAKQAKSNLALGRAAAMPVSSSSMAAAGRPASVQVRREDDGEEEDEPGRTATFTERKITRDRNFPAYATGGRHGRRGSPIDVAATPPDPREDAATIEAMTNGTSQAEHELEHELGESEVHKEEEQRPRKKKATSYLDELLSKKKAKQKKKNK